MGGGGGVATRDTAPYIPMFPYSIAFCKDSTQHSARMGEFKATGKFVGEVHHVPNIRQSLSTQTRVCMLYPGLV